MGAKLGGTDDKLTSSWMRREEMVTPRYLAGSVRALLETAHVSEATRAALRERLERTAVREPAFFTVDEFASLRTVCDRLIPQPDRAEQIDIAGEIDRRLAAGTTDGWRYDLLPADGAMYRAFLGGLDDMAKQRGGREFSAVDATERDEILAKVQRGDATGEPWERLPAEKCFEEVLAEVAEIYYGHPLAQEEFGYVGMADLPGWTRIGLNERDERELLPVSSG